MIRSMTGYGTGKSSSDKGTVTVEIKSVNHRFLDISIKRPSILAPIEERIRKRVESFATRGRIDILINFESAAETEDFFEVNMPVARSYFSSLNTLKKEFDLPGEITLSDMLAARDIIGVREKPTDEDFLWELVSIPLEIALESTNAMKLKEGKSLKNDIKERLVKIREISEKIDRRRPEVTKMYKERLKHKVGELMEGIRIDEARIAQEVAIMAERSDITEEIVRINSHLLQFDDMIESESPVGRKLDFLIQETNREVNTIGSKSFDSDISTQVVNMKAELERIREQVQNIE